MFNFGKKWKEEQEDVSHSIKDFDTRLTNICNLYEEELVALKTERDELIERISKLETQVANLNKIVMAVANGFSAAMEELDDV